MFATVHSWSGKTLSICVLFPPLSPLSSSPFTYSRLWWRPSWKRYSIFHSACLVVNWICRPLWFGISCLRWRHRDCCWCSVIVPVVKTACLSAGAAARLLVDRLIAITFFSLSLSSSREHEDSPCFLFPPHVRERVLREEAEEAEFTSATRTFSFCCNFYINPRHFSLRWNCRMTNNGEIADNKLRNHVRRFGVFLFLIWWREMRFIREKTRNGDCFFVWQCL